MCLMYMYAEILIKISIFYKNDTGQSEKNIIQIQYCQKHVGKTLNVFVLISIIYVFNVHV